MRRHLSWGLMLFLMATLALPAAAEAKSNSKTSLINPLRKYHNFKPLKPFSQELQAFVDQLLKQGDADEIAVYFRSMNDGVWIGINEKARFAPASLMKVPIMMAYLKSAEKDPGILKKKLPAETVEAYDQFIPSKTTLSKGEKYAVDYLLELMICDSNNDAMKTLTRYIDVDGVMKMYDQLGYSAFINEGDFLSLKAYVGTFRVLYNATYLNEEMSEKALRYLARTAFEKGLRAGIPKEVPVAHKFGEYGSPESDKKQLHDVAIVYHQDNPYLLGVMTRGGDYSKLAGAIEKISAFIYNEVDSQYKELDDPSFQYKFEEEA